MNKYLQLAILALGIGLIFLLLKCSSADWRRGPAIAHAGAAVSLYAGSAPVL